MKRGKRLLAVIAASLLLALFGCGGDGGVPPSAVVGVWTGSQKSPADGAVEFEFIQSGGLLFGAGRITVTSTGSIYTGNVTGTVNGNHFDVTVDYGSAYGKVEYVGDVSGDNITGTYTLTSGQNTQTGDLTLTRSSQQTVSLTNTTWSGTATPSSGQSFTLTFIFTSQTNNTVKAKVNDGNGAVDALPPGATVIGNKITMSATVTGNVTVIYVATVSADGNTITGNYARSDGGSGTYTLAKQ